MPDPMAFENELLVGLAPDEVAAFLSRCKKSTYSAGTELFEEGAEATTLYLIVEGEIDLRFMMPARLSNPTIAREKQGRSVGWSAIVPPHKYLLSGHALTRLTVYEVTRDSLNEMFLSNYHFGFVFMRNIAALIGERFSRLEEEFTRMRGEELFTGW